MTGRVGKAGIGELSGECQLCGGLPRTGYWRVSALTGELPRTDEFHFFPSAAAPPAPASTAAIKASAGKGPNIVFQLQVGGSAETEKIQVKFPAGKFLRVSEVFVTIKSNIQKTFHLV